MIKVRTISRGVKCPENTWTQPNRNNQMRAMSRIQMAKHGSEVHFAVSLRRSPRKMGTHNGRVCTMCRSTPLLTAPTT